MAVNFANLSGVDVRPLGLQGVKCDGGITLYISETGRHWLKGHGTYAGACTFNKQLD